MKLRVKTFLHSLCKKILLVLPSKKENPSAKATTGIHPGLVAVRSLIANSLPLSISSLITRRTRLWQEKNRKGISSPVQF
jgi:hypothetical protein